MIKVIDNDHSGEIDFTEFLRSVMYDKTLLTEENVRNAFYYFDKDHNEKIEKEELFDWLNEEAVIPVNIVEELIQQADINGDGFIDLEEFQQVLLDELELD
jgi:Ca2+-binding EF-hand superfamily protein